MATLKDVLAELIETPGFRVVDGLRVTVFPSGVINIDRHPEPVDERQLVKADVDATRAAFAELGYTETEAWLPVAGMSWLSNGVSAGVSFRVTKNPGFFPERRPDPARPVPTTERVEQSKRGFGR